MTVSSVKYADDTSIDSAVKTLDDLFEEFVFADDRSKAVAISAMVGLYAAQLVLEGELRPAFTITKNAEGAGATTLTACAVVTILGHMPTGVIASDDAEMRKTLTAAIREGRQVLVLDNVKGRIDSPSLEAFVSAATWNDRLLGANETITGANNVTVFVTANGATVSPDWRRRTLFIELHLDVERAEDRVFKKALNVATLKSRRPELLAALWALVKNWDAKGRPSPSRSHSAFPVWAAIIGGIVEEAGFGCALDTANVAVAADEDGDAMRTLIAAMEPGQEYVFHEITAVCRKAGIFLGLVGDSQTAMTIPCRSAFGKMLVRYADRLIGTGRFIAEGKGHGRRYWVQSLR